MILTVTIKTKIQFSINKQLIAVIILFLGINDPDKAYGEEREILIEDHFIEAEDSHFFTYFLCMAVLTIMAYLVFHNKKKVSVFYPSF